MKTESVSGVVTRVAGEPRTAARGGYLFRGLELGDERGNDRIFIIFPVFVGDDLYEFPLLCWEGAQVAAYKVALNNKLEDGTVIYHATPESEVLLEPHRLVNVTEAVQAAECIRSVDVRFRVGRGEPFWMAKGRLIHTLFDHLVHNREIAPEQVFVQAFRGALQGLKEVLPGSSVSVDEQEIERDARDHFRNLLSWWMEHRDTFLCADTEVDHISSRWGLKGRADLVLHGAGDRFAIAELKTGRVPVESHMLQLLAYSLLFAREDGDSLPDAYAIYSTDGRAERMDGADASLKRTVLQGRNRVVALKHSYTLSGDSNSEPFKIDACGKMGRCLFNRDCFRIFGNSRGRRPTLAGREKEYYTKWFRLVSGEVWYIEGDFAQVMNPATLSQRVEEGVTLPVAELLTESSLEADISQGVAEGATEAHRTPTLGTSRSLPRSRRSTPARARFCLKDQATDFAPGEEILLHRGDPSAQDSLRATVIGSDEECVHLSMRVPVAATSEQHGGNRAGLSGGEGWFVDRQPFKKAREAARQTLFDFLTTADKVVVRVVVHGEGARKREGTNESGEDILAEVRSEKSNPAPLIRVSRAAAAGGSAHSRPEVDDLGFSEGLTAELNEDQEASVTQALCSETYHLVHGPPGTGKTRVLARLIRMCLDRGERVLVASPTNVALDGLLLAVIELGVKDFIRVGRRSTVSARFLEALDRIGSPPALLGDLAALDLDIRRFRRKVLDTQLVGATAYQCAAHPFFCKQRFDRVIVDEAGQLDEPSALAPLALARRFVLGGDHLQLPPVVQTRGVVFGSEDLTTLEQSLFERLFRTSPESRLSRLRMQYRMNLEVQDIPSRLFYDGRLYPCPEARRRRLRITPGISPDPEIDRIIDPEVPVVFVDVEGPDSGKARPEEAEVACRIVESLLGSGVASNEVGIITPYRAQQSLIRRRLSRNGNILPLLTVDTVDRFQGGEREVIILSLSRSDEVTSFLANRKRLNVSLSRARSKLILLGHAPVLEGHPLFASVLEGLERIRIRP
jgi:DNA replication ATP-dependent helicase Dna2